jgi:hypothetical protein
MNIRHSFNKLRSKYYGPGSPLRYVRKATLELTNPGATRLRSKLGAEIASDLPANLQQRLSELETKGFAEAGDEIDSQLLTEMIAAAEARLASSTSGKKIHEFFSSISQPEDLRADSIYVRFALQPAVQKLACAYFNNTVPYLCSAHLLLSRGRDAKEWINSQLWHLDYADCRTLRFWVYITDVTAVEDGPFTYMPVEPSKKVPNTFYPKRVTDEQIAAAGLADEARQVYGRKGKIFYIDTSRCYHLGSRLKDGKTRLVYDATFLTHKHLYPSLNNIRADGGLSDVQKCFLTL